MATVTSESLREIIAGCEGVTPGFRWMHLFGERTVYTRDPSDGCRLAAVVRSDFPGDNQLLSHIARLDPITVKAMAELAITALETQEGGK